jgi:hypothetical protein
MKIGRGVHAILRFGLKNLRGITVEVRSGAVIYSSRFIKVGSGFQK